MVRFNSSSNNKAKIPRTPIILGAFLLVMLSLWLHGYLIAVNYNFNGTIQKVTYPDIKHIPTITIKGKEYDLIYNTWNEKEIPNLEIGDSCIKKKGTTEFIVIRNK